MFRRSSTLTKRIIFCKSTGLFKRKYKLYVLDSSIAIPRTTQYNRKRLKTSPSCVVERESGTSACNVVISTSTTSFASELSSSNATVIATHDPNLEEVGPMFVNFSCENDVAGSNNLCCESSGDTIPASTCDSTDSVSQFDSTYDQFLPDDDVYDCHYSEDSDVSSVELDSDTDSEIQYYTSDEEEGSDNSNDNMDTRLFTDHEKACMAVLAYVSRHCITNEAAKDLIDLVKVTCPESSTFKTLSYSKVQEVCGKCELHVYDICEKCHRLFPLDDENSYHCATAACTG